MPISQARRLTGVLLVALLIAGAVPASATSMLHRNVVDLIDLSQHILVGRVVAVSDCFENGVPFTEVTVSVDEAIKGTANSVYTFRQFGLRAPRVTESGRTYVAVSPDGWPRFETGEQVVLFLYKPASITGLRTTVGLLQGKFTLRNGKLENGIENQGLFRNVSAERSLLTPDESRMLEEDQGGLSRETFLSFVRKAVQDRWIERGKLDHVH